MKFPKFLKVAMGTSTYVVTQSNMDILEYLADKLRFRYEINSTGPKDDVFLLAMQKGEADIGINHNGMNEKRYQYTDFSAPHSFRNYMFIIEEAEEKPKFETFASPFNGSVWITFLCAFLLAIFGLRLTTKTSLSRIFLSILASVLKQPMSIKTNTPQDLIFYGTWLTLAGTMSAFYTALFLSYLTVPTREWTVKNFPDLTFAVLYKGYSARSSRGLAEFMKQSPLEHLRILGQEMVKNGWTYESQKSAGLVPQIGKREAWISALELLERAELYPPSRVKVYSDDSLGVQPYAICVRKDFCCKEQLNRAIEDGMATGLFDFFAKRDWRKLDWAKELRRLEWNDGQKSTLKLKDFEYAFYLLLIGHAVSFVVFLFECVIGHWHLTGITAAQGKVLRKKKTHVRNKNFKVHNVYPLKEIK